MIQAFDWMDKSSFSKDPDQEVDYFYEYEEEVSELFRDHMGLIMNEVGCVYP